MSTPWKRHHALRDTVTLSGMVAGATLGLMLGPAGLAVAIVVGGLLGLAFGVHLERTEQRAVAHDRELDDTIGVTTPDLDSARAASRALDRVQSDERQHHRDAERELLELSFALDHPTEPVTVAPPMLEPACPDCLAVRRASANALLWCGEHARHHPRAVLHYEYPPRFGVGSMLLRPPMD